MSKRDLLLEIGLEELPARFVTASMKQLSDKVQRWLTEKAIEFGTVEAFSTPRRLAVLVKDVEESQKDIEEEAKGPAKKSRWTAKATGLKQHWDSSGVKA
jgi:glycyl-tRNA synthetase beta chain